MGNVGLCQYVSALGADDDARTVVAHLAAWPMAHVYPNTEAPVVDPSTVNKATWAAMFLPCGFAQTCGTPESVDNLRDVS